MTANLICGIALNGFDIILIDLEKKTLDKCFVLQACWVIHYFSEVKFKQEQSLTIALELTRNALCTDKELPVRVEAAIALQMLLTEQEKAKDILRPHIRTIILGRGNRCCSFDFIDDLAPDCGNSSAWAMELLQSCAEPSIYFLYET